MADVRYQYRGVGLLPPDLAGWLNAYVARRLPIAEEEWKLRIKQAVAAGEIDPTAEKAWIDLYRTALTNIAETGQKEIYAGGIQGQAAAGLARALVMADADKYGTRGRVAIANARERGLNWRMRTKFAQDVAASGAMTAAEMASIADIVQVAQSSIANTPGDKTDAMRNAVKMAAGKALADARTVGEKNPIHGDAYLGEVSRQLIAAIHPSPEDMPAVKAAVETFILRDNGVSFKEDANGLPDVFAPHHEDPIYGDAFKTASTQPKGAGVSNEAIPDLTGAEYEGVAPSTEQIKQNPEAIPVSAATGLAPELPVPEVAAGTAAPAAPAAVRPSAPPPMSDAYTAPGGIPLTAGAETMESGTGVGAGVRAINQDAIDYARSKLSEQQQKALAAKSSGAADIPAFRLAPEKSAHPDQARYDAVKAKLDAMRKSDPARYARLAEAVGERRRADIPDSAIAKDQRETSIDVAVKDPMSPEWSRGFMGTTPSERAADMGRKAATEYARMAAIQRENKVYDSDEGERARAKFLQDRAVALLPLNKEQRQAFADAFAVDESSWNTVDTMVKERERGAAKRLAAAGPPGMFESPEEEAAYNAKMAKAAESGPTPNDVREKSREFAASAYEAAVKLGEESGDYEAAIAHQLDLVDKGDLQGLDKSTIIKDFKDLWDADERPGPRLANQRTEAALRSALGAHAQPGGATPPAMPVAPGEALRPQEPPPLPGSPPPMMTGKVAVGTAIPVKNAAVGGVMNPAVGSVPPPMPSYVAPGGTVTGMGASVEGATAGVPALAYPETPDDTAIFDTLTDAWKDANPKAAGEDDDQYHARAVGEATKLYQGYKAQEASP